MPRDRGIDNPTAAEMARVRKIKKEQDKRLGVGDERFLIDLFRRCSCVEARNVLIDRLSPVFHDMLQKEMRRQGVINDIGYEKAARHKRPLGTSYEVLSKLIVGRALNSDENRIVPRGVMAAIRNCNNNRGRICTYLKKEITGIVSDFKDGRARCGEGGVPNGAPFHSYVSHSSPAPGRDGKSFTDLHADEYEGPGFDHADHYLDVIRRLPGSDLLTARFGNGDKVVSIAQRLSVARQTVGERIEKARDAAKKEAASTEPSARPHWGYDFIRPSRHNHPEAWRPAQTPERGTPVYETIKPPLCGWSFATARWRPPHNYGRRYPSKRHLLAPALIRQPREHNATLGLIALAADWYTYCKHRRPFTNVQLFSKCPWKIVWTNQHHGSKALPYIRLESVRFPTPETVKWDGKIHSPCPCLSLEESVALAWDGMFGRIEPHGGGYSEQDVSIPSWELRRTKPVANLFCRPEIAGVGHGELDPEERKLVKRAYPKEPAPKGFVRRGEYWTKRGAAEDKRPQKPIDRVWRREDGYLIIPAGARNKSCAKSAYGGELILNRNVAEEPGDYLYARLSRAKDAKARVEVLAQHRVPFIDEQKHQLPLAA